MLIKMQNLLMKIKRYITHKLKKTSGKRRSPKLSKTQHGKSENVEGNFRLVAVRTFQKEIRENGMRKQWKRQWLAISKNCLTTLLQKGPASAKQDYTKESTVQTSHMQDAKGKDTTAKRTDRKGMLPTRGRLHHAGLPAPRRPQHVTAPETAWLAAEAHTRRG